MYGIDAAREPHGFAMAAMRLSTYRKIAPGRLGEFLFYDHPSGYAPRPHVHALVRREPGHSDSRRRDAVICRGACSRRNDIQP